MELRCQLRKLMTKTTLSSALRHRGLGAQGSTFSSSLPGIHSWHSWDDRNPHLVVRPTSRFTFIKTVYRVWAFWALRKPYTAEMNLISGDQSNGHCWSLRPNFQKFQLNSISFCIHELFGPIIRLVIGEFYFDRARQVFINESLTI
jgi:hypothetical protein